MSTADRTDLIEEYQARYDVFNEYAPKLMSAEEAVNCRRNCNKEQRSDNENSNACI